MFIGRKDYLEDLEMLWRKRTSSIVACRGRRRIGKSTLFREFARRTADRYLEIEGLPPDEEHQMTNQDEIDHFVEVLDDQTGCGFKTCTRWYEAFSLTDEVERFGRATENYRRFMNLVQKYVDEESERGIREIRKEVERERRKAAKAE